ncbi:DUF2071 domain-containing protein [uncultured Proteiniphilum sp.]|uniref:YqjF family protein n=1 Tax=uncultured Proteiniphilum sp. TaxID=497637 RepID=UPI002610DECE|nr:DUF2071 domain-containing protein [uncultured Proteiniphilum sp.]
MKFIQDILADTSHRPFELPDGPWIYYQEWNNALFLHWTIPFDILRKCVPSDLLIDTFEGNCYISLVAFTMEKTRPKFLPSIDYISNFDGINLRTYIDHNDKKGVYFLSIGAGKSLSSFIAKTISGLPYEKFNINRTNKTYSSNNIRRDFTFNAEFEIKQELDHKTELDKWLTERYCLYLDKDNKIYRYDIHHKEWTLKNVNIKTLNLSYKIGDVHFADHPPTLSHYSDGVKVIGWRRQKV